METPRILVQAYVILTRIHEIGYEILGFCCDELKRADEVEGASYDGQPDNLTIGMEDHSECPYCGCNRFEFTR